jgi:site-specific DNA-adenine methylase
MKESYSQKTSTFLQVKGYPGLETMAEFIVQYIPKSKIYVEPFAGLGRTTENKHEKVILNDKSDYAVNYLKSHFHYAEITQEDFETCIFKHDSGDTFFLIDPPWRKNIYQNNALPFNDRTPIQYYDKLLKEILPKLKGSWILCVDRDEHEIGKRVSNSGYENKVIQHPNRVLFGRPLAVRMASNKPFLKQESFNLDNFLETSQQSFSSGGMK